MSQYPVLALDFDGVIADSLSECLVVSWNAYQALHRRGSFITSASDVDAGFAAAFSRLRPFIRTGEDYILIHMALETGLKIDSQKDFDRFAAPRAYDRPRLREAFYTARISLFSEHRDQWLRLNPLYPGMADLLQCRQDPERLLIISTKRSDFIAAILAGNGISFPKSNIRYAGPGSSKRSIIEHLLTERSITPRLFHFVDDQVDTLRKVAATGVHCILAAWGYTGEAQIRSAEASGISVACLDGFIGEWKNRLSVFSDP